MIRERISEAIRRRMGEVQIDGRVTDEFLRRVMLVHDGFDGKVPWDEILPLQNEDLVNVDRLPDETIHPEGIQRLVVIKLNGGLGTSMGLEHSKSIIPVHDSLNFLQILAMQIRYLRTHFRAGIPLLFMNSFRTREDTLSSPGIARINGESQDIPVDFLQNRIPRIEANTLLPVGDGKSSDHWCPPGHGDIYLALQITGILDKLLSMGYTTAFISNADNLAATVDGRILSYFHRQHLDFAMEITPKTEADTKGGVLIRRKMDDHHDRIELLEVAQVEDEHVKDFTDIQRFPYFNTNNLWIQLESLRDILLQKGGIPLNLIVNRKKLDGVDILQLETAMGGAISHFPSARGLVVTRDRFAPVKNCSDLLLRRSDVYRLNEKTGEFSRTVAREPSIKLDSSYSKLSGFESGFPVIPSLKEARSLEISGPVEFDRPMQVKGNVRILNGTSEVKKISELVNGSSTLQDQELVVK